MVSVKKQISAIKAQRRSVKASLISALFVLFVSLPAISQSTGTCADKLRNAQLLYEKGQVEKIPSLLTDCLKAGFKKEEELAAYKLLIQAYLLNDKIDQADSAMLAFLKRNPEYKLSSTDHSSFTYLFNSFVSKPFFQIGVHAGTSMPFLSFVDQNLTAGEPGKSVFRTNAANLLLSAEARFMLKEKLQLCIEAGYSRLGFSNRVDYMNFGVINYSEVQNRIVLPVTVLYNLKSKGKFTPYLKAGAGVSINLRTNADISLEMTDRNNPGDRTGETLLRTDSRAPADLFIQAVAGISYKIPHGCLFAELRTDFGLLNQNRSGGETVDMLEYYYLWSDPGFRINNFCLNAGYIYVFYKPSKRNNK